MPSLQDLQAMHNKPHSDDTVDSKIIVDNYVSYFKYKTIRIAQSGNTLDMVDNIHRNNREFHLIKQIIDELKIEFAGCKIELNCYADENDPSEFKWSLTDGIDDPKNGLYEIIVHWE